MLKRTLSWLLALQVLLSATADADDKKIRVLVWDSQQPAQKSSYKNFLGNHIAEYLKGFKDFEVKSVRLDDPGQGLSDALLEQTDVLVMWVHGRKGEVSPATARRRCSGTAGRRHHSAGRRGRAMRPP